MFICPPFINAGEEDIQVSVFTQEKFLEPIIVSIKGCNLHMTRKEGLALLTKLERAIHQLTAREGGTLKRKTKNP